MMVPRAFPLAAIALLAAACSNEQGTDGSESDFANRVGTANPSSAVEAAAPVGSTAVKGPPPAGADVLNLEQLGDIAGVNLGARAGACTFASGGQELLIAAGPSDRAIPGKGVVRIGGRLIELDTPPGGIDAIRAGTRFAGEGFTVAVRPTGAGKATITITDAAGQTRSVAGDYVCA